MNDIKQKAIKGIKWVAFSRYAQKGLSFITFIILARLLEPKTFGLFAMAFIVIDGLGLFKNFGVDSALVQRKDDIEKASHTAFWMMPFMGIVIFFILYFGAPMASLILKEPNLTPVIRVLGIIFVLGAIENIPASLLNKELRFKELAIRELVSSILFSISAVIFALFGLGVWSLVYAYLIRRVSMFFFSWSLSHYRPKMVFDMSIANELLHFGKFIFSSSIIGFLIMNIDNFLVGRLMGAAYLGYYALAYNISSMTTMHLSGLVHRVMYPTFSKLQDARKDIRGMSLRIMRLLSIFSFPFGVGIILFSSEIVQAVYGAKWLPLVPPLKVLALCSMLVPILASSESVFTACGKPKWSFYLKIPVIVFMALLIPIMSKRYGLLGVGLAVTFSKLCIFPTSLHLLNRLINLSLKDIFMALRPTLFSSVGMLTGGLVLRTILFDVIGAYSFIVYCTLTMGLYILLLYKMDPEIFHYIKKHFWIVNKVDTVKDLSVN